MQQRYFASLVVFGITALTATLTAERCGQLNVETGWPGAKKVVDGKQVRWHKYPWMVRLSVYYESSNSPNPDNQETIIGGPASCNILITRQFNFLKASGKNKERKGVQTIVSLCGGTIITPRHVLTAGHCLMPEETNPQYVVHFGASHNNLQTSAFVSRIYKHPGCVLINSDRALNDIAILELRTPLRFGRILSPACLPRSDVKPFGLKAMLTGWGNTIPSVEQLELPDSLKEAEMKIISKDECQAQHNYANLTGQLCAVSATGYPGIGDSGGPLMYLGKDGWTVLGIVSWGNETRFRDSPFVFTNVAQFRSWIDTVISQ